jgi:hypothetical protein
LTANDVLLTANDVLLTANEPLNACRMLEIQASSGVSGTGKSLQELLDSEDFNEAQYDKAMQQMFSEEYYEVPTHWGLWGLGTIVYNYLRTPPCKTDMDTEV